MDTSVGVFGMTEHELNEKRGLLRGVLIRMFTNFGVELVFSADLCYNGANRKPLPLGEVAA